MLNGLPFNKLVNDQLGKSANETTLPILANSQNYVRKKGLTRQKNVPLKIAAPGPTSPGFFEVVLLNKDESCIGQLFMKNINHAI